MNSEFKEKIHDKTFRLGIVGLGYVGIPLSLGFARKGIKVTGFDIDEKKINQFFCELRTILTKKGFRLINCHAPKEKHLIIDQKSLELKQNHF